MTTIDINDPSVFKTGNFRFVEDPLGLVIDSVAVMIGDYDITRKYAANLILKALLRNKFKRFLFEDPSIHPVSRNDYRVIAWKNKVLSVGECEKCGSKEHLEAHHIVKWADYPMGRIDVKNGMCLCHKCHTDSHVGDQSYYMMKKKYV